ncbi:MAG: TetR/AcrR family transcriptional regulator [Nitrospirota bacterium]
MRTANPDSPTKEKLLDAAQRLMLAKGFPATTVEEICETAGLTKGSFFHYFESKDDLGQAVLDRYAGQGLGALETASFRGQRDPLKRILASIDHWIDLVKDPSAPCGCLLGNFAQELSDTHPKIRAQCARHFDRWTQMLKQDFDEAKSAYRPRAQIDTQGLAEHYVAVLEGALLLTKAKSDRKVFERNLTHLKRYIRTVFEGE